MVDVTAQTLLTFTDSSFPSNAHNQIELPRRRVCLCLCVSAHLQIWQDDLIHQGLPLSTLGGTKIILQRGAFTFTCIHARERACIHAPTPRPGSWLGAAETCYSAHTETHKASHSHLFEPGYLPVHRDECCKPSTGMWDE